LKIIILDLKLENNCVFKYDNNAAKNFDILTISLNV